MEDAHLTTSPSTTRSPRPRRAADAEAGREPPLLRRRARDGARGAGRESVYLRGLGDYERYGLKLTGRRSRARPHGDPRVEPRGARAARRARLRRPGLGAGWIDGDLGHGPAYRFTDPDGHVLELHYEAERYEPPRAASPSLKNQPQRYVGRGAAVKRLDHVNVLAQDVRRQPRLRGGRAGLPPVRAGGARRRHRGRRLDQPPSRRTSSSTRPTPPRPRPAPPPGLLGRHARGGAARRRPFPRHGVPIEAAPSKHAMAQGFFLYGYEPGGNRIEVTTGGHLSTTRTAAHRLDRGRAGEGPGLGRPDDRELPHLRHAARRGPSSPPLRLPARASRTRGRSRSARPGPCQYSATASMPPRSRAANCTRTTSALVIGWVKASPTGIPPARPRTARPCCRPRRRAAGSAP